MVHRKHLPTGYNAGDSAQYHQSLSSMCGRNDRHRPTQSTSVDASARVAQEEDRALCDPERQCDLSSWRRAGRWRSAGDVWNGGEL